MLSDGPYGEGASWKETRRMMGRSETVEMWVSEADPPRSTTVKALQGGADYTSRMSLADRDGGTDLTMTFGADLASPSRMQKLAMALFGGLGMRITRKAFAKDLAEIAAKADPRYFTGKGTLSNAEKWKNGVHSELMRRFPFLMLRIRFFLIMIRQKSRDY